MRLQGKKIIVVGGSGKIGKELSHRLISEGASILVADREISVWDDYVKEELTELEQFKSSTYKLDLTNTEEVKNLIDYIRRQGVVDAVVNCSYPRSEGFGKNLEELSYEEFSEGLKVHLGSYFLITKEFALLMKSQGHGNIVNFSSIYGCMAPRFELYQGTSMVQPITYAAVKSGLIHISKYFSKYFREFGLRINCVSPGGILDNQPEVFLRKYAENCSSKGMLDPKDVIGAVVFLLSDDGRYVNGQNLVVDDGFCL